MFIKIEATTSPPIEGSFDSLKEPVIINVDSIVYCKENYPGFLTIFTERETYYCRGRLEEFLDRLNTPWEERITQ